MDSRASDTINKSKVDTFASNPSQRRPSRLGEVRAPTHMPRRRTGPHGAQAHTATLLHLSSLSSGSCTPARGQS